LRVVLTVGVWVAALGSAAALTYDLNRPLHENRATSQLVEPRLEGMPFDAPREAVAAPVSEPAPAPYVPTITIVGRTPRRAGAGRNVLAGPRVYICNECAEGWSVAAGPRRSRFCRNRRSPGPALRS
jgi:hypothetical protein